MITIKLSILDNKGTFILTDFYLKTLDVVVLKKNKDVYPITVFKTGSCYSFITEGNMKSGTYELMKFESTASIINSLLAFSTDIPDKSRVIEALNKTRYICGFAGTGKTTIMMSELTSKSVAIAMSS